MKLLLDTQIALWVVTGNARLSRRARTLLDDGDDPHVSVVTIWEIAIKHALQRGSPNDMPVSGTEARRLFEQAGFALLPVTPDHAAAVDDLPPLHGDPFDRMLIAQARTEPMHFLTADRRLEAYGMPVMAA